MLRRTERIDKLIDTLSSIYQRIDEIDAFEQAHHGDISHTHPSMNYERSDLMAESREWAQALGYAVWFEVTERQHG